MIDGLIEIIGLNGTVVYSPNKKYLGMSGKIIDETKNMIMIHTNSGVKLIPKNICKFEIYKNKKVYTVNGLKLLRRSYERLEINHD